MNSKARFMNEVTVADVIALVGLATIFITKMVQVVLNHRNQDAAAQANEADAIESLTISVKNMTTRIDELQSQLDTERIARRVAEAALADLTRRFVILENDNKLLVFENTALKDALEIDKE